MVDKFGGFAKLREIVRVLSKDRIPDTMTLVRRLRDDAEKHGSHSPFRRPVANDNGKSEFSPLELDTIVSHVKFAEKLELATFRSADDDYLPGLEPVPQEYSEKFLDTKIIAFLESRGISKSDIEALIGDIDFKDIESLADALQSRKGRLMSEVDFKKCVRLLGDCGISLRYSRKKTYAMVSKC
jgi:hypothetical protein